MASRKEESHHAENENEREARRIIERVERESEKVGASSMANSANKVRDHFMGQDEQQDDHIEILGKRIGRALSVLVFVGLAFYLYSTYIAPQ